MGYLDILLDWHVTDPVNDMERARNDAIESHQGNRNPFVDRPEFVAMVYGGAPAPLSVSVMASPASPRAGMSVTLRANVVSPSSIVADDISVYWRSGSAPFSSVTMALGDGTPTNGTWVATTDIPGQPAGTQVSFYAELAPEGETPVRDPLTGYHTLQYSAVSELEPLDVSGFRIEQYGSAHTYVLPANTEIQPNGFLVVSRNMAKSAFESLWDVTLADNVTFVNSGGSVPMINGDESFEVFDTSNAVAASRTATDSMNAEDGVIERSATNASGPQAWIDHNEYGQAYPGQADYAPNGVGLVITKFGEPSDFNGEFLELFYDAGESPAPAFEGIFFLY